ncbi:MAG: 4-hydroxythreonine-4-phosphate dehydrogenase PdxA [Polyangiales bacterium]
MLLAISIGCPGGIGAEVALAALDQPLDDRISVLFGDLALLSRRASAVGFDARRLASLRSAAEARALAPGKIGVITCGEPLDEDARTPGRNTPRGGAAQLAWIDAACDAVRSGEADALVTAPASKEAIARAHPSTVESRAFRGHTEHLGARLGDVETVMAFVAERLTITLATTHLALSRVASSLVADDVARAAYWTCRLVDELALDPALAVAVLALNPHAGEAGLLGDDEKTKITPGIELARARLASEGRMRALVGPLPAESAIRTTVHAKTYAACVAMYHDQATIPSKLVAFGDAVNVTLGLPIVRTSVDHGTAYDLAGKGTADAGGMRAALDLAVRLVRGARMRAGQQPPRA